MSATPEDLPTSAYDYELPADLIAMRPAARREESRLLVLQRATGALEHRRFGDVLELISAPDVLVVNETRVFPARLIGRRPSGGRGEVLLLRPAVADAGGFQDAGARSAPSEARNPAPPGGLVGQDPATWEALVRPASKLKPGRRLVVAEGFEIEVVDVLPTGNRVVRLHTELPPMQAIEQYGHVPLPPYIRREDEPADRERYQTVYARQTGSVAAPTAGLHFTPALLERIEAAGVAIARIVLHVGVGTFRPVGTEDPAEHAMHAEWYEVSRVAADTIAAARARGGAVWAVGTTVVRTLESVADEHGRPGAGSGWTDLYIRPPYRFRAVDRLITNFHLPRSTLLMLVAAFGGYEPVMRAYQEAIRQRYRFYSYGDAMAIV